MQSKLISILILLSISLLSAKECDCPEDPARVELPRWVSSGVAQFQFSQSHFKNWQAGGESALNWATLLNLKGGYEAENYQWINTLDAFYGRTQIGDKDSEKSQDEIKAKSIYEYNLNHYANPFGAVSFKSQFTRGYNVVEDERLRVSSFMDPGYLKESAGWGIKPFKDISVRVGGYTRQIWGTESTGYADDVKTLDRVETFKNELGAEIEINSEFEFDKTFKWTFGYLSLTNFEGVKEIDTSITNSISAKIKDWLQVGFFHEFLYDYDLNSSYQTQSNFSLNLMYTLF